jgi:hypothetical protein
MVNLIMNNVSHFYTFMMGIWVGLVIMGILKHTYPDKKLLEYNDVIAACEQSLPRNQYCKINAVPVPIGGN